MPSSTIRVTHRLLQRAQVEAINGRWFGRRLNKGAHAGEPLVRFGTLRSADHDVDLNEISDANGVDGIMYWALAALQQTPQVDVLVVMGFAYASDDKQKPNPDQVIAAFENASAFAFEVLARLPRIPDRATMRGGVVQPPPEIAYLTSLAITNIRALADCRWDISASDGPGWHVMLGDNGAGKSTLLRSIALTLFDIRDTEGLRLSWASWLHFEASDGKIAIKLVGAVRTVERSLVVQRDPSIDAHRAGPGESTGRDSPATVFSAGYGPFRRFSGGDLDYEKEIDDYPRLLRHMSLFSERVALTKSLDWLKDLRFKQLEGEPEGELLTDVKTFINGSDLLPPGVRLTEVSSDAVTFVDGNDASVPIEELSDGFRSVLSLTLDLIRHMALAYGAGNLFSPVDPFRVVVAGIVLIDEIDVHLHPSWQHRIGDWFRTHFPAVQFIVATHSPIICQGADSVFLLPQPGTGDHGRHLTGIELERVRNGNVLEAYGTGVFGHGVTRSEQSKLLLKRLTELNAKELDEELSAEEQAEQADLRAILPTNATSTGTGSQS